MLQSSIQIVILFLLLISVPNPASAQPLPDYQSRTSFLMAPPSTFSDGLLGFANPANLAFLHKPEARFIWSTAGSNALSLRNWGLFTGIRHVGFSVQRQKMNGIGATDFRLSGALGSRTFGVGLSYGWSAGRFDALGRQKLVSSGLILRPNRYLSTGLVGNFSLESSAREGIAEIGIRPLGTTRLTLFADAALQKGTKLSDMPWSAGAAVEVGEGIHLIGRYFRSEAFTFGLSINFGRNGLGGQSHFDSNSDHSFNSYQIRLGGMKPSFLPVLKDRNKRYAAFRLKGRVAHLKYALLDGTLRLFEILKDIRAARDDDRVSAIALNLSSLRIRAEHAWEIREELKAAQAAGKKVIIFLDTGGMTLYHLASVADRIMMDPSGSLMLPGYALGRTYFKATLEKLGLGFDEWRFFKYKSAMESLSRDSMSVADREQRQQYVDDWYELTRSEVSAARGFTHMQFDSLIDDVGFIMGTQALKLGLADTLARWSEIDGIVAEAAGDGKRPLARKRLLANAIVEDKWGQKPKIAVVYALGTVALDGGIRGRWLGQVFNSLQGNKSVKAVVFRVDSPGGDVLASDVVAEALQACAESKPVIISMGQVAASGGYYISMYGDHIFAGPNTLTGSIGVIGGWIYDKGFSEKLGMTSDIVMRGKHADLGRGVVLPFLNIQVPARNLTSVEREIAERGIRDFYNVFVTKVANGREMPVSKVSELAQGRVYSGIEAKRLGLVDELGGLFSAVEMALKKIGLDSDEVELIEVPKNKGLVNLRKQLSPLSIETTETPGLEFIKVISEHPAQAILMLPPGTYPSY